MMKEIPSADAWLQEAKTMAQAGEIGMYLLHNGVVRETAKGRVRAQEPNTRPVIAMEFFHDREQVETAVAETRKLPGIKHVRVWLNEGRLGVGEDLMYVLIGGDIRPHVTGALDFLVGRLKTQCVTEREIYG